MTIERGRVVSCGSRADAAPSSAVTSVDLGRVAILPGLVNAHTHLELSHLRGQVPPAETFVSWIRGVLNARRPGGALPASAVAGGVDEGIAEALRCGTALVGDISNTLVTVEPLAASPLAGRVFHELIGFNPPDAPALVERAAVAVRARPRTGRVRVSLAAHSPYSVAPSVFREIRAAIASDPGAMACVHLSESEAEQELIRTGGGPWRVLLEEMGAWNPAWRVPNATPVEYLDGLGFFHERAIAVHGVQLSSSDLATLVARGTTLVTCPRSNRWTAAGTPPVSAFYASGVRVAVGTDSLASAPDLNVFAELAAMRALAPEVPAASLLKSATLEGARALGFDADYGSIEPGRQARLIAVDLPVGVDDVEEYLVTGVDSGQVRWVEAG